MDFSVTVMYRSRNAKMFLCTSCEAVFSYRHCGDIFYIVVMNNKTFGSSYKPRCNSIIKKNRFMMILFHRVKDYLRVCTCVCIHSVSITTSVSIMDDKVHKS